MSSRRRRQTRRALDGCPGVDSVGTRNDAADRSAVASDGALRDDLPMSRELFAFDDPASVGDWHPIDDAVMGGVSRSRLRHDPAGFAVFEGAVSLERGGGFASVRSRPRDLGATGAVAYALEVRGDGRRHKLNLRTDESFDGVNYQAAFDAPAGAWTTVRMRVSDFAATFRGRRVAGAPPLEASRVRQAGFEIADAQAGAFALAIRSIRAE
jgi:hypothetical protein